jgi:hypothetical protein
MRPPSLPHAPGWVPRRVAEQAEKLYQRLLEEGAPDEHCQALLRLLTDDRMKTVWGTLQRRRRESGYTQDDDRPYEFPAIGIVQEYENRRRRREGMAKEMLERGFDAQAEMVFFSVPHQLSAEEAQQEGMAQLLHFAVFAVRFGIRALTMADAQATLVPLQDTARALRESATKLRHYGLGSGAEAADYAAQQAEHFIARVAPEPDDPLIIGRNRGDATVRGLTISVGEELREVFGSAMETTAKTIAAVALNRPSAVT